MLTDLRRAFRRLKNSPGFTVTAVLTLALGIGANTAIFTLMNSILLRPLPFPHQEQLMRIGYGNGQTETAFFPKGWVRAIGEHSSAFSSVSAFGPDEESNVEQTGAVDRVFGAHVMVNALDTLGLHPELGRFFSAEDAAASQAPTVVLSYGYWRDRFGASPAVIGQIIRIDGVQRQIIGVMPRGVRFPYADSQFLTPVTFKGGDPLDSWATSYDLRMFARLKDGVSPLRAQDELRRLHGQLLPLFPWRMPDIWAADMTVVPLLESQVGDLRPRLLLLFGAVGLILLIACANVANLMLARSAGREREMGISSALGATPQRLVRQLLTESIVLGLVAGAAGVAVSALAIKGLIRLLPADTPRLADVSLGWQVFAFAAGASVLTGLLFGAIPAFRMAVPNLREALHSGSRSVAGKPGQFRVSMVLVMGQIALSVLVLTAAGLMLHSFWTLSQVDPGFRTERIVTAEVSLNSNACQSKGRCFAFFNSLQERLQGIPGAQNSALSNELPLLARTGGYAYDADGHPRDARQGALIATGRAVSPGYFATLGMTLVQGRFLDQQDQAGTSRAVVINKRMAEHLWPGQNPIGRHVLNVGDEPTPAVWVPAAAMIVVGVVNNAHEGSLASGFEDEVYLPLTPQREQPTLHVLLATHSSAQEAAAQLRRAVAELDPLVPVTRVRSLNEVVASSVSSSRSLAVLLLTFGGLALTIGGIGVYSLIAYVVSWRTREIGIRLALGAQRDQIVAGVLRQSLRLALGGCSVGLVAAGLTTQLLRRFLFDVHALDPLTFCAVPVLMLLIALAAAWVPARRAASVDPMTTLRLE